MTGVFVGSTIHKNQLREYGFTCPIHVVSLPYGKADTMSLVTKIPNKENQVIFASRLDKEKNPYFLIDVIDKFLSQHPDWNWVMTTSGESFKSNLPDVVSMFERYSESQPRFKMLRNLSKEEYYTEIARSSIMFNCSLQDYVSWTSIEAHTFGTQFVCPEFRSFTDFAQPFQMYQAFDVQSALDTIETAVTHDLFELTRDLSTISDIGRIIETYIMVNGINHEINIWHEFEYWRSACAVAFSPCLRHKTCPACREQDDDPECLVLTN